MALRAIATGAIAEPVLRWTPQQKAVLDLRLNATASSRDKNSGQWADIGSPLWIGATFWDDEAKHLSEILHKGDRVTVEGTLVIESFQRRDGTPGQKYSVRFPRFLGVLPSRRNSAEDAGAYGSRSYEGPPVTGEISQVHPQATTPEEFDSAPF